MSNVHVSEIASLRTQLEMGGGVEEAKKAIADSERKLDA